MKRSTLGAMRAFTIVELLVVVGIISVLTAIAVPNMIDAQTRAKVARTESDLRSLATAIEAYRVDDVSYPKVELFTTFSRRLAYFTTPVAYISTSPEDPFYKFSLTGFGGLDANYIYCSGNIYFGNAALYNNPAYFGAVYSVAGRGPDQELLYGGYCMAHPQAMSTGAHLRGAYDPTNGTVSEGDIIRLSSSTLGSTP